MQFVNPIMNERYQLRPGQSDCDVIIVGLQWRSKLSRITPRVAEFMIDKGTNIITRKTVSDVNIRPGEPTDNQMGQQSETGTGAGNGAVEHTAPQKQPEPKAGKAKRKAKHT
jgi:hypothetical protein